jgi:hypothetical protein
MMADVITRKVLLKHWMKVVCPPSCGYPRMAPQRVQVTSRLAKSGLKHVLESSLARHDDKGTLGQGKDFVQMQTIHSYSGGRKVEPLNKCYLVGGFSCMISRLRAMATERPDSCREARTSF